MEASTSSRATSRTFSSSTPPWRSPGVVGRPDEVKGEEVVAFVQLNPGQEVTPEELHRVREGKARASTSTRARYRIVDAVPLTPVFKIDRKKLRTML